VGEVSVRVGRRIPSPGTQAEPLHGLPRASGTRPATRTRNAGWWSPWRVGRFSIRDGVLPRCVSPFFPHRWCTTGRAA